MGTYNSRLTKSQKVALIAIFSALLIVVRAFRIPIHMPGVGGVLWFIILLIASIVIQIPLPATEIAFLGGLVNSFMFDNPPGPFSLIKYIAAGITIDLLWLILKKHSLIYDILIGAIAYSVSFLMLALTFIFFGIKMQVLSLGLPYLVAVHAVLGGISGFIVYTIVKKIPIERMIPNYS